VSATESCALYYFPEIPCAAEQGKQTAMPSKFSSGPFGNNGQKATHQTSPQDPDQIQSMLKEAFEKGLEQGRAEMATTQQKQINNAVNAFETSINEMHRVRQHDIEQMEKETVRLALAIAKKIIGYETEHNTVVQQVVKQAMEKVNDTRQLVIRLNPLDLDALQQAKHGLIPGDDPGNDFRFEADEGIQRGGCVIETNRGDIDARIDRQIKVVEALLVEQLPK
jgi:flagellar assembly protein FliH